MWEKMIKHKKNWFTLAEVLSVCVVFAIMILAIIWAISRAYSFMGNIRLKVRATNFAREWIEMMYNIRDTNRRKCSWKKDANWLYIGTWWSNCNPGTNSFTGWLYSLKEWVSSSWDRYIYAEKFEVSWGEDPEDIYDSVRKSSGVESAKIQFTWSYMYSSWVYEGGNRVLKEGTWDMETLLWGETDFYRLVRVYGVYCKSGDNPNQLVNSSTCKDDSDPKEIRFCVKVFYKWNWEHTSELCSIMTNFEK